MKTTKIVLALLLALCMIASIVACSGDKKDDETTPATTTETPKPAETTTAAGDDQPATDDDNTGDDEPVATDPENVDIAKAADYGRTPVDLDSVTSNDEFTPWADGESAVHAFDGLWEDGNSSKIGGTGNGNVVLTFKTAYAVTAKYYEIVTGNDTSGNPGRNPSAWTLYGSTDEGKNWTELDKVTNPGMEAVDYTPYAYEIDSPAEYQWYKIDITCDGGGFQLNEIMIMGPKGHNVYTDVSELTAATVDAESVAVEGINPFNENEAAVKLFDGDSEGTKLCGNGIEGKFTVTFNTTEPFAASFYTLVTGGDTASYGERNPKAWTLYGIAADGTEVELDKAFQDDNNFSGLYPANVTTFTYKIAKPATFQSYKIVFETDADIFQMNELTLYAANTPVVTDDISGLSKAAVKADSVAVDGINPFNENEAAVKLFDGDKEATKLCGNGISEKFAVTFETEEAVAVKYYTLTTGGDTASYPERNPSRWAIAGSEDGESFKAIANVTPKEATDATGLLAENVTTYTFKANDDAPAYKYYKVTFYSDVDIFQMNELELFY